MLVVIPSKVLDLQSQLIYLGVIFLAIVELPQLLEHLRKLTNYFLLGKHRQLAAARFCYLDLGRLKQKSESK